MKYFSDLSEEDAEKVRGLVSPNHKYCNELLNIFRSVRLSLERQGVIDEVLIVGDMPRKICDILSELERDVSVYKSKIDRVKSLMDAKNTELVYLKKKITDLKKCQKDLSSKEKDLLFKILFM